MQAICPHSILRPCRSFIATLLFLAPAIVAVGQESAAVNAAEGAVIKPFKIAVPDDVLDDLKSRLARTRFPDQIEGAEWNYGVELSYMKELVAYWKDQYDWRAQERMLNELPQFTTNIDDLDVHFVHVKSKEKDALPLVLVHGWPGSFYEFYKVIGPLTDPVAHGGKAEDAFHVVVPSLPGFGFSGKPKERGWSVSRMSDVVGKLMARLGYDQYGAQGGDWGAGVANWLGNNDGAHVVGVHINFPSGGQPMTGNPWEGVPPEERERWEKRRQELQNHGGYSAIQGTRPQTIGYALNDSPAGQAAWIIDKFWHWSDHGGKLENSFTRDELLTNVMIYWITQSPTSSARIYFERQPYAPAVVNRRTTGRTPVGVALFPKEINVPPRKWIERSYNLVHFTEMPRGGHFAALETPELLVQDVRLFFGKLRKGGQ